MELKHGVVACLLGAAAVYGQKPPVRAEFEVASIKPSAQAIEARVDVGVHVDGAQVRCTQLSLKDYIRMAYRVKDYQIVGPDWIAGQRFDIAAKLPEGAERQQIPDMLKALLSDRFHMTLHHDSKEFPVYGLVVAKGGLRLKETPPDPAGTVPDTAKGDANVTASGGRGGVSVNLGNGSYMSLANDKIEGKKLTMTAIAEWLARFVDRPVLDMTEKSGNYDILLELTPEQYRAMLIRSAIGAGVTLPPEAMRALDGVSDDSLFSSLQAGGLKLETRKASLDVLVIDHVEKTATEN